MEEGLRQPSNLDPLDRDMLALLGHRIERWDTLKDESRTFQERKQTVFNDLEGEIVVLNARYEAADEEQEQMAIEDQLDQLFEEQEEVETLEDTQAAFDAFADERAAYYIEVRQEFLKRF